MPPDRGAIKKSPYEQPLSTKGPKTSSTKAKDSRGNDAKDQRTKSETTKVKESSRTRDGSLSRRLYKETSQDSKPIPLRERTIPSRSVTSRMQITSRDSRQALSKTRESVLKRQASIEAAKVSRESGTKEMGPRRTQPSQHSTQSTEKSKLSSSSRRDLKQRTSVATSQPVKADTRGVSSTRAKTVTSEATISKSKSSKSREKTVHQGRPSDRQEVPQRLGRDRTRTRTLSPGEIKIAKNEAEKLQNSKRQDQQKEQFSKNMASLSAAEVKSGSHSRTGGGDNAEYIKEPSAKEESDEEYEYEDDFEDYESDFEEDTESDISDEETIVKRSSGNESDTESEANKKVAELTPKHITVPVEEEKKLDSGNYDLAQRRRKSRELQEIRKALDRENEALLHEGNTQSQLLEPSIVAVDEGFEEGRADDTKKFSIPTGLRFINFANARKRKQEQKKTARAKKRGELLLEMIRLDVMNFTLFELPPISYDVYMKSYGRSNTLQAQVQTNDDNLSEEVQTDEIVTKNKWTQKPVSFCTHNADKSLSKEKSNIIEYSEDHLGVGGDTVEYNPEGWKNKIKVNTMRLNQFVSSAGQVMSILLEERAVQSANKLNRNLMEIPFSDGYISLGLESIPFLADRAVTILRFPYNHPSLLLTVHKGDYTGTEAAETLLHRSVICIWNILEPSLPQKVLTAVYEITSACFDPFKASLVFAGLEEGSVCAWDLRERSSYHQKVETAEGEWVLRSPTYNTAEIFKEEMHTGKIVALHPLGGTDTESELNIKSELPPIQLCSLDEVGTVNIWSVVYSSGLEGQDLGLAPWGHIRLVPSLSFSVRDSLPLDQYLRTNLECFDLQLDNHDRSHMYIGTNTEQVIHGLKSGGKPRPLLYLPNWNGYTFVRCIEPIPFGKPFFLIGCEEGTIRLHCQASHKPLATLAGTGDPIGQGPPVTGLQWSRSRPSIFFALDLSSRIHVWDLLKSDIYPQYTVPFGTITAMQLSPDISDPKNPPLMALATGPGRVEIHQLRSEYSTQKHKDTQRDLAKFLQYVSII